jgi:trans-2,3-dihydro-3-hydroxyanthranilate isomerase
MQANKPVATNQAGTARSKFSKQEGMMPKIEYLSVDVFTGTPFCGNPLAVIPDARQLTDIQMQKLASEFNYSETSFVLPPDDPSNTARVRIFTPTDEIPFAGHPNVGTGFVLAGLGKIFGRRLEKIMTFEEDAGPVKVEALYNGEVLVGAKLDVPLGLKIIHEIDPACVADCVSLTFSDMVLKRQAPVMASVGLPFAIAEVASLEVLARATPKSHLFAEADRRYPASDSRFSLFIYARSGAGSNRLRARMFAPLSNIVEDPATGSAAAALGALLASVSPASDMNDHIVIEQGVEMGRPSVIDIETFKRSGTVYRVSIGGHCVSVMRGEIAF